MGMLMTYHEGYRPEAEAPESEAPTADVLGDLTDEQVAALYAEQIGGKAKKRATQVKALAALAEQADESERPDEAAEGDESEDDESEQPEGESPEAE